MTGLTHCQPTRARYTLLALTNNVHALQEDVSEDVVVHIAPTLDSSEQVSVARGPEREVHSIENEVVITYGEGYVGNVRARWILPATVLLVIGCTVDLCWSCNMLVNQADERKWRIKDPP